MIDAVECEILISLEEVTEYLKDVQDSSFLVMVPDQLPIIVDTAFIDKSALAIWINDTWKEGTIIVLVP